MALAHPERVFDDGDPAGDPGVTLRAGEWVGWRFPEPRGVSDLSVTTTAASNSSALGWEILGADENWTPVTTTHQEALLRDRTTPFTLTDRVVTPALRVRAEAEVTIRQLEVFDLD